MSKIQTPSYFTLLLSKGFYPIFWVQFLGAFNDNLYKNSLVMLITFGLTDTANDTGLLITFAAGLFILPFFLFSSLAGQIADRYPKYLLVQKIKLAEVLIMFLGAIALISQDLFLLFFILFLMGTQSAFFGPIKYSVLPEILSNQSLIKGNGLISGSTFIAILLGTIVGGLGVLLENGIWLIAVMIVVVSIIGYLFSLLVRTQCAADSQLTIEWNIFSASYKMISQSVQYKTGIFSAMAISWFWFIGAVLLSQIPALVKYDLQANDSVVIVYLTLFSIGIALGAGFIGRLMHDTAHIIWHWIILLCMSFLLVFTVWSIQYSELEGLFDLANVPHGTLQGFVEFLSVWPANLSLISLGLLAMLGGAYIVPLYTILQTSTPFLVRARMVAVNNILNAFLMVLSSILLMLGFSFGLSLLNMLLILAMLNIMVAILLFKNRFITVDKP